MSTITTDPASVEHVDTEATIDPASAPDPYAARDAALEDARQLHTRRVAERDAAFGAAGRALSRLQRGDDTLTAIDLAAARVEEERADLLEKAAKTALGRAHRRGPHRPVVSEPLALIVGEALGIPAHCVDVIPEAPVEGDPVAYVRQNAPTKDAEGISAAGALACESIEVIVFRGAIHKAADWSKVEKHAEARGIRLEALGRGSEESKARGTDHGEIVVKTLWPEVLTLPSTAPIWEGGFSAAGVPGRRLAGLAADRMGSRLDHSTYPPRPLALASGEARKGTITRTARGGQLITTVTGTVVLSSNIGPLNFEGAAAAVAAAADTMAGLPFAGLGRVSEVRIVKAAPVEGGTFNADYSITLTAKAA